MLFFALVPVIAIGCSQAPDDAASTKRQESPKTKTEFKQPPLPPNAVTSETSHYLIYSTATDDQTRMVGVTVEGLYTAYTDTFRVRNVSGGKKKLILVLYKNRDEFKRSNWSSPWAEAYYLAPRSHAYFASDGPNPYHWMVHEATHQLEREVSEFKRVKWVDEGLASYFGASRISGGTLQPGEIDEDAYPIWWLDSYMLSGVLDDDIASGQIIPLKNIIEGRGGPDINRYFNQYYVQYWSLSHFLFHYQDGVYAARYKKLIAGDVSLENFERIIGPVDRIQKQWYGYLSQIVDEAKAGKISSLRDESANLIQVE
jgi:hypothetical protein